MKYGKNNKDWISFVEKLSVDRDLDEMIPEILKDMCGTFEYGCGFVYKRDYEHRYLLCASYEQYQNGPIKEYVDLTECVEKYRPNWPEHTKTLSFLDITLSEDVLAQALGAVFGAKSMIFIPIVDRSETLLAFVGLVDRRTKNLHSQDDMIFMRSVLSILANDLKMRLYRQEAENAQRSLEGTLDHMGIDVYVNDFETHEILYLNRSMAAPYGTVEEIIGKICWQVLYDDKTGECDFCPRKRLIDENGRATRVYSWDYQRPFDGAWFRVFSAAFRWVNGRMAHIVSSVDITENKRNEEMIRRMAGQDYLTNLPNRYNLTTRIDELIQKGEAQEPYCYILFFDLDGFKQINDTLGHRVGDEVLRMVGEKFQAESLVCNHIYRYGGDEFVILLEASQQGRIQDILAVVQTVFSAPWDLEEGRKVLLRASIGISRYPDDGDKTSVLIRKADQAMYAAKRDGKARIYFYNRGEISPDEKYKTTGI